MNRSLVARLGVSIVLLIAVAATFLMRERFDFAAVTAFIDAIGIWGPIAFVLLFAVAAVVFLPGAVFGLAGGALFGPLWALS